MTDRVFSAILLAALLLAACSDEIGTPAADRLVVTTPSAAVPTETPPSQEPDTGVREPSSPVPPAGSVQQGFPDVSIEPAFGGVTFERMTGMYQDVAGNWYVTEQAGRIQRIEAGSSSISLWLDVTDVVDDSGSEMGLLGMALAPDFGTSGVFYLSYTGDGHSILARYRSVDHVADPDSEQRLLMVPQPFSNHNGGQIAFGPDGYLYMSLGDGGGDDPDNSAQTTTTLLGSLLRIDVSLGGAAYEVPSDNPFVSTAGFRPEIWAYGFRNPWRFSFDIETGEIWLGDVGESAREEVDLVVKGGNYGWRIMEGFVCRGGGSACDMTGFNAPVLDYVRGSGGSCSITGGFVYRGQAIPELEGAYVFSDFCNGILYGLRAVDGELTEQTELVGSGLRVGSLAQGNDGELYVLAYDREGGIYKLVP